MNSPKKIGLMACTGIVAGNMMGSDIALLPSNLASIGSVALFGWAIALVGALALAYVFARLSTVNPQSGLRRRSQPGIWFPDRCSLLPCQLDRQPRHRSDGGFLPFRLLPDSERTHLGRHCLRGRRVVLHAFKPFGRFLHRQTHVVRSYFDADPRRRDGHLRLVLV